MWIMPQVTIYMDENTAKRAKEAARAEGLSLSKWIARVVKSKTRDEWPASVKALAGAWKDFPTVRDIRRTGEDVAREPL